MDINERIARRRAEMAGQKGQASADAKAAVDSRKASEKERRTRILDEVVAETWKPETKTGHNGEDLFLAKNELKSQTSDEIKTSALKKLLDTETRISWTPAQNWLVVGSICAGIALLHIPFLGIPLLGFGLWRRSVINKKHRAWLLDRYPHLFARIQK